MRRLFMALIAIVILASLAISVPVMGCSTDSQVRSTVSGILAAPACNGNSKRDSHAACLQEDAPGPPAETITIATVKTVDCEDDDTGNGQDGMPVKKISVMSWIKSCVQKACESVTMLPSMRSAGPPLIA